jgi:hypothetical protein
MTKILMILFTFISFIAYSQATIYVTQSATGSNDGTSWTDAYTSLDDAITTANSEDNIWVATGTYYPKKDKLGSSSPTDNRTKIFLLNSKNLYLYGGFSGGETQLSQRDWATNPTILSGDIGTIGTETDNCYTVFGTVESSFILDGFTVSDGYADGLGSVPAEQKLAAGIHVYNTISTTCRIKNCIIKNNAARAEAGLLCQTDGGTTDFRVENTRFTENLARWSAPFSMFTYSGILNPTFINCLIDNNTSDNFNGEPGNSFSGGRFIRYTAGTINGKLINCTFTKNSENNSTVPDVNRAVFGIQGVYNNTEIYNTIFWDNNVNSTNTSIGFLTNATLAPNSVTVYNTISADTMSNLSYVTSTNNIHVDPLFSNPSNNDFTLTSLTNSSAVNGGDTLGISQFIPLTDLNQNNRIYEGTIDMGCYESQNNLSVNKLVLQNTYSIYPNPVSNVLNIDLETTYSKSYSIQIISTTGQVLQAHQSNSNSTQINVSQLPAGVYFIQLRDEKKHLATRKFIKE